MSRHVTPVVILPNEPVQPQVDETLVQLDSDISERNGSSPDLLLERCVIKFDLNELFNNIKFFFWFLETAI